MTVSREITKWGGKICFVYLSAIDLTRYEILNFGACARIYAARGSEMWNDARLDRILDNYLQIMKQYLGFEIFLNYYLPFKKKSLWFNHHQTRYPFVTQNTLINETRKVTLWNSNWFIQTEFPQLMESIVTRKYNVSPREIASYESSFEEFVPRSIEENCRLREEDWPRISKKTLRYRSVYTRRERGEDWKGRGEDRVEWYCGDERVYSWRSFGVGGRSVRYSHNSTYE